MDAVGSSGGPVRTMSDAMDLGRSETAIAASGRCERGTSDISLVAPITAFGSRVGGALALGWARLGWRGGHQVAKWYFGYRLLT